ncbi:MAG: hypothetical protein O2954_19015, partial [bacterium]|nr:hypothetical protein [bacterium]
RYKSPDLLGPVEEMAAAFSVKEDVIRISQLTGRAGRSDFSAVGRLEGALAWGLTPENEKPPRPFLVLDITSRVLDLDEMIPVVVSGQANFSNPGWTLITPAYGAVEVQDLTSPVLWLVRTANARSEVQVGELKSDGVHYRNLRADALAQDGLLRLDNVHAGLFGGTMKAQVEVDARPASGTLPVRASVGIDSVQAGGMLGKFMKWRLPLQGRMGLSLTMDGKLDSTLELVEKDIQAEGVAGMEEGKLVNWSALKEMGTHVGQLGFLDFNEVLIQSLLAPFKIEHSRIFLNELKMNAAGLACRLNGSAGIDGSLDYTLDVDLPASRLNVGGVNLGSALGSFFGGGASAMIPLRIRIGGTADQPQVKADLQPAGKTQAKEKEVEVRDRLKEKGKGLLKKLF